MTDTAPPPHGPANIPPRTTTGGRAERIRRRLAAEFVPLHLAVVDDSARHAGHAGAGSAGETHYRVDLVSRAFGGLGRVARSRAVHAALAEEFATGLHALELRLRTPEECDPEPRPQGDKVQGHPVQADPGRPVRGAPGGAAAHEHERDVVSPG